MGWACGIVAVASVMHHWAWTHHVAELEETRDQQPAQPLWDGWEMLRPREGKGLTHMYTVRELEIPGTEI